MTSLVYLVAREFSLSAVSQAKREWRGARLPGTYISTSQTLQGMEVFHCTASSAEVRSEQRKKNGRAWKETTQAARFPHIPIWVMHEEGRQQYISVRIETSVCGGVVYNAARLGLLIALYVAH